MAKKFIFLAFIVLLCVSVSGCVTRLTDFTLISTKNIDLARGAEFKRAATRVQGQDCVHLLVYIPLGVINMKEAIDRAIESVPGAIGLLDGVIYSKAWWIIIYGQISYVVEGTPLIDPKIATAKLESNFIISKLNKQGDVVGTKYVSKSEYDLAKKKLGI